MQTETYFDKTIQTALIEKLHSAQTNIRVAVAWFTDPEIIAQLKDIALRGVKIEVIVSDNDDNRNSDYSSITDQGVTIFYFPIRGYGTMHHKFCIIDEVMVATGSYNWTVNAKKNNGENMHIIKDPNSVQQFIQQFENLKRACLGLPVEQTTSPEITTKTDIEKKTMEIEEDFEEEWNIYLNSHVANYDKTTLRENGRKAAENTHGNPEVIPNKMNMIYQDIVVDTEVDRKEIEKLKGRLENKINNYQNTSQREAEERKITAELQTEARRQTLLQSISVSEDRIKTLTNEKKHIVDTKIPTEENKILFNQKEIEEARMEITPPPLRRRVWLEVGLLLVLMAYLFVFYSSMIYTILYGKEDAKRYMMINGELPEMEVFNSEALNLALERGTMTLLFISFFTILPFVFGFLFHAVKNKKIARWLYLGAALVLDGLLAYLICKNVYDTHYQTGTQTLVWEANMIFSTARFWIVLVLGAVPYLAWGALYEHISSQFDNVSRNVQHHKIKQKIENLIEGSRAIRKKIEDFKDEHLTMENKIINEQTNIQQSQTDINHLEYEQKLEKDRIHQDLNLIQQKLENQKDKILTYLDKDQVPVSRSIFKERVTTFISGWEEWLYSFYNIEKANKKFTEAQFQVESWTNETFRNAK